LKTTNHGFDQPPSDAEIRAAVNRVIASAHLSKSPQLANFLRFVVEQELAGHGSRIKAYTIAADALGRDSNFDPQADPIVRVEAGRLRRALKHYYTDGGCDDPIVIELPRGKYVPVFRANTAGHPAIGRLRDLQRKAMAALRENIWLVLLVVVIAAAVSTAIDLLWLLMPKLF
jgi:hypothetical protein